MTRDLTAEQVRVLGSLIEKERTTPDQYPLSTNALVAACNQRNNRDPIVAYDDRLVDTTMLSLREAGLARTVRPTGNRAHKHRHVLDEAWGLDGHQLAVLAVLLLRGPQTATELRTRTERYDTGDAPLDVDAVLGSLAALDEPLVTNVGRAPGQSQDRWMHLAGEAADAATGPTPDRITDRAAGGPPSGHAPDRTAGWVDSTPSAPPPVPGTGIDALAARVRELEHRLARLEAELGIADR